MMTDNVHLRNIRLPLALSVGPDAWHRSDKPQPAVISVRIAYPSSLIASAANQDTVAQTLDYGKLYRTIEEAVRDTSASQIQSLAALIARTGLGLVIENIQTGAAEKPGYESTSFDWQRARDAEIWIRLPKSILRADQGLTYRALFRGPLHEPEQCVEHEFTIEGILCYCILGVNPHERREKQAVQVTLMYRFDEKEGVQSMDLLRSYQDVTRQVAERVDSSSFQTVEALATLVARIATYESGFPSVTVRVEKPSAQPFVEYSGVEITRDAGFFGP